MYIKMFSVHVCKFSGIHISSNLLCHYYDYIMVSKYYKVATIVAAGKSKNKTMQSCFWKLSLMSYKRKKATKMSYIAFRFKEKLNTDNFLKSHGFVFWPLPFLLWFICKFVTPHRIIWKTARPFSHYDLKCNARKFQ